MVNRDDLFIKAIVATAMSRAGKAETEVEVVPAGGQRIDVYSEPDPALVAELADMGMLGELGGVPAMFEAFSETPGLRQMRALILKQQAWFHELERRARVAAGQAPDEDVEPLQSVPFPAMVVLSPGKPKTVLEAYQFKRERRGLYTLAAGFAVRIVVLSELPRTRATVLVRLGSRKLRAEAVEEILRMPPEAWERKTAEPILVQFDFAPRAGDTPEETMLAAEIRKRGEEIIQGAERRGERRLLLRQLRRRFGELPEAAVARVEGAEPAELERWGEQVLTATSLGEVLGDS